MVQIIGHRGLPRQFPDNSLAGITAASALCDMVEVDVRRTADGVAVLSHDPFFCGQPIVAHPFDALRHLEVGGCRLASLDAALSIAGPLNLEIKQHPHEPDFDPSLAFPMEVARTARPTELVSSFHWPTMAALRAALPALHTGLLVDRNVVLETGVAEALAAGHRAIIAWHELLGPQPALVVAPILAQGLEVFVWTVNDPERAIHLARAAVTGIVTDVPQEIRRAIESAGAGTAGTP